MEEGDKREGDRKEKRKRGIQREEELTKKAIYNKTVGRRLESRK